MNRVFIGMSIIMFIDNISTLSGILKQIMLVLSGFFKLGFGNSLSNTDSISQ